MGDRMKEANELIGMVKYAAEWSESKYVIGREGWKTMIVSKLMYGCGALAWYQRECDDLEVIQSGFGRWLWEVVNTRNELVRGESGWSSFAEREVKCIVDWLLRIVYEESLVSDIGRACLMEVGYKSRWWGRCNHVCDKFGLWELVNLLWLKNINKEGMSMLGMKYDRNVWKKTLVARIQEDGRRQWRNGFSNEGPIYCFLGHADHADPLDGWRCCSQKRVMSRPIHKNIYMSESRYLWGATGLNTGCTSAQVIITLVDKITKSLDSGDIVIGVFFVFFKAFDTVNHKILFKKLFAYGIRGNILNLNGLKVI